MVSLSDRPIDRRTFAPQYAAAVVASLSHRYPYVAEYAVMGPAEERISRAERHPAFASYYDWHSCVQMHWLGVRLLAFGEHVGPGGGDDTEVLARLMSGLVDNLTEGNLSTEAAYLAAHPYFEQPYGWGWALRLCAELSTSPVSSLRALAPAAIPLVDTVAELAKRWIAAVAHPVRHGVHTNSAFSLGLLLSAARTLGRTDLQAAALDAAKRWYGHDRGWPSDWERSGGDFLSAGLAEADLMRMVLPAAQFPGWCVAFFGEVGLSSPLLAPVTVLDEHDPQQIHLYGLDLHRAGAAARIAEALQTGPADTDDADRVVALKRCLRSAVPDLLAGGLAANISDTDPSTHWLATFAWDAMESVQHSTAHTET